MLCGHGSCPYFIRISAFITDFEPDRDVTSPEKKTLVTC